MVTLLDDEKFEVTGRRELDEECRATPAVSNGFFLVRTKNKLLCMNISPN
jgi:hypothetical protein